jgi:aldose 1-epimerase
MVIPRRVWETAVELRAPGGALSATLLPAAGMVCSSLRHRGEELLAQRGGLEAYLERGSSFAIPLLHPWANRLSGWDYEVDGVGVELDRAEPLIHRDAERDLPMHGVLAGCPDWRVSERRPDAMRAWLNYGANPRRAAAFPFPHRLQFDAELSDHALTISLELVATGDRPVPVSFGFHPYLAPGGPRADWRLSGPVPGLDGLLGERALDEGYAELASDVEFSAEGADHRLGVNFLEGFHVVQIFAPAGSDFVAFEPMTAPSDALRTGEGLALVPPGGRYRAAFALTVDL